MVTQTNLPYRLGYKRRPTDPRQHRYNLANYTLPVAADFTKPVFFWGSGADKRWPCEDQRQMGSCSAFGAGNVAAEAYGMAGGTPTDLDKDWLYFKARQKEGSFPSDAGSDPADVLDLCRTGAPPQSAQAGGYVDNPALDMSGLDAQATLKYVDSFHPIYPTQDLRALVVGALASGYPVNMASLWVEGFFTPVNGILPQGHSPAEEVGGHDFRCWGWLPPFAPYNLGLYLCRNNWSPQWGGGRLPNVQPGDFAIPCEYGLAGSLIEECFAVVGVGTPAPTPTPTPLTAKITGPATLQPGQPGSFSLSGAGAAKPLYSVNWGDGQATGWGPSAVLSHTYAQAGAYSVQAWLGDNATGLMSPPVAMTVTVAAAPTPAPTPGNVTIASATVTYGPNGLRSVYTMSDGTTRLVP